MVRQKLLSAGRLRDRSLVDHGLHLQGRTLGSFGNFGLEIQTWESTSALMSKSDHQLVEI